MSNSKRRRSDGLRSIDGASLDKVAGGGLFDGGWFGGWFGGGGGSFDRFSQESTTKFLGHDPWGGSGRGDGAPSGGSGYGGGHNSR